MATPKLLFVDDVQLFLEMQQDIFRRERFTLLTAGSGREALEVMRRERPDLVFMDLYMPGISGDEACLQAKSDETLRSTPIVMVTNSQRQEDIDRCERAGCAGILFKPINRDQFLTTAYRLLRVTQPHSQRRRVRLPVRLGFGSDAVIEAKTFDLGLGGFFAETPAVLPMNSLVKVELDFPLVNLSLRVQARVAWSNRTKILQLQDHPEGLGLHFQGLTEGEEIKLKSVIFGKPATS